jgi:2-methylcitrate dehydratase PrpD
MDTIDPSTRQRGLGASRKLAAHAAGLTYDRLPSQAVHAFKRALLDYLTCAVAGSRQDEPRLLLEYFAEWDKSGEAAIVGHKARLACPNAAFVNGTATHSLDFDDGLTRGSVHPAGFVFPALLAIAEKTEASARELIVAGVAAYDVALRIASAMHPTSQFRGFHNTPTAGVFGAAAGVSRLFKLDAGVTLNALGLAGSFAAGLREYVEEGAQVKRIHPGKAARDGITCAEFARRGLTGPGTVLEGRHGFFQVAVDGAVDWDFLLSGLGQRFEITNVYFKPYPACRHFHAALDAVRELRTREGVTLDSIASVDIGMYALGVRGHDHRHAYNLLDAQMSAPVSTALALVYGDVTAATYDRASLEKPEVRRLTEATNVHVDPECERIYPGRRGGVAKLTLKDGRTLEKRVLDPRGEGENQMSDEDLAHKFRSNCEPIIGKPRCDELLDSVWTIERSESLRTFFA